MNENETSSKDDNGDGREPTAEKAVAILQMAADDKAEEGDGGDSDVKGGEVNLHFEAMMSVDRRLDEHVFHLANDLDIEEWGSFLILQSPVRQTDGFLLAHQSPFLATAQSWMLLPFLPMLTILADGTSLFFSPSMHQKKGEMGRRNR
jgi:hypothetical protein